MDKLLKMKEVVEICGFPVSSVYALIKKHQFPAPVKVGCSSRWLASEIDVWLQELILNRED